jgi:RNA polymerase sigma-70 factor (ECF subfamily)
MGLVDHAAFEAIVSAHHDEIYRYLLRTTGQPSDADDLSQDTFLRAFRAFGSLAPEANVRAWLFAIATNLSRNHFRARKRRRAAQSAVKQEQAERSAPGPDGVSLGREVGVTIEVVIGRLPLKQRLAFLQRKVHGFEYETIGANLGCSAESARAHVFQALRKIRQALRVEEATEKEREP